MKTFIVFYKTMPDGLREYARKDGNMSIVLDGVRRWGHINMPRLSVFMDPVNPRVDPQRVKDIKDLLQRFKSTGEIIDFS